MKDHFRLYYEWLQDQLKDSLFLQVMTNCIFPTKKKMSECSLIFWNYAFSWLTHTVFPPVWTSSSLIIKVCAILKNVLFHFHVVGVLMWQMNQWLNGLIITIDSSFIDSSLFRWIKVQPLQQYNFKQKTTSSFTCKNVVFYATKY